MSVTAIFGGTFNPFHIGHYKMLEALQNDDNVEKILVMPDRLPPHKVCDFLAGEDERIEMCREIVADFSKAELCLIEFERQGKSYSYDTVTELKRKYSKTNFAFVCGGDMLISFDCWYKYEELMKLLPFIVFKRTDTDLNLFDEKVKEFINMGMNITVMGETIPTISSTYIRNNIENSKDLLPTKVYNYIMNTGIYNAKK